MAADCQIDDCGVRALGRCATCQRAFCLSHRAPGYIELVSDKCQPCAAERWLNDPHRQLREQLSDTERFLKNEVVTLLRTAVVPCLTAYQTTFRRTSRRILFRTVHREEWHEEPEGDLWMVGKQDFEFNDGGNYGGTDVVRSLWTALFAPVGEPVGEIRAVSRDHKSQRLFTHDPVRYRFRGSVFTVEKVLREALATSTEQETG